MRIPRIYFLGKLNPNREVELPLETGHYIVNVLRLKINSPIILFNGDGNEYFAHIEKILKKAVIVKIQSMEVIQNESPLSIHLLQGLSKGEHMDFTLQKAVELGVSKITPIVTDYCQVKLDRARALRKHTHWQAIVISACQQSGRSVLPELDFFQEYHSCVAEIQAEVKLICHPGTTQQNIKHLAPPKTVALLVGPEGGFSEPEIEQAEKHGFIRLALGPRILRTETAGLAAISFIQSLWGDLG